MEQILPVIDTEKLQQKANEYAMKGAEESLKEFYTGWNSPYRKAIEEELNKHVIGTGLELPDIIGILNEKLSNEVDQLANTALSKTFIPLVKRFLTRESSELKLSDVLKEFIEYTDEKDRDDYEAEIKKDTNYGWYNIELSCGDRSYKLTLHEDYSTKNETPKKYQFLSLPNEFESKSRYGETMKLSVDGATLEMPFRREILSDRFISYIARLVICSSKIIIDCDSLEDDMFPEKCHCH